MNEEKTPNMLRDLFRILTPEEITNLTTIFSGEEKQSLTSLLLERFNKQIKSSYSEPPTLKEQSGDSISEDSDGDTAPEIQKLEDDQEVPTEQKGAVFILDIKRKMERSQRSLKSREVIDLYKSTSSIDIENQKLDRDDLSKSAHEGVLVNKKQY